MAEIRTFEPEPAPEGPIPGENENLCVPLCLQCPLDAEMCHHFNPLVELEG